MAIPGPGLEDEDWSDDEFEGYVNDEQQQGEGENVVTTEELEIGGGCEVSDEHTEIPEYNRFMGGVDWSDPLRYICCTWPSDTLNCTTISDGLGLKCCESASTRASYVFPPACSETPHSV